MQNGSPFFAGKRAGNREAAIAVGRRLWNQKRCHGFREAGWESGNP